MAERYQSSAKKSTKKFEVVGDRHFMFITFLSRFSVFGVLGIYTKLAELVEITGMSGLRHR